MKLLADKLRPTKLDEIIGQTHLVGENKIITNLVKNKKMFSMIFYGKPGIGKTSIASAIVNDIGFPYKFLNATTSKKDDFEYAINEARMSDEFILVIDEIHRMNKDKQDLLLPYIENGTVILIGLTTSNPYFKINSAIRSRCHIFELINLSSSDILKGLQKAANDHLRCTVDIDTLKYICNLSNGDFRYAINLLETAYYSSDDERITLELIKTINSKPVLAADSNESDHYNLLSALQKSIRGSDPDAAVHYLARLLEIEDYESIYRRLSVIAYEDIGLANPAIGSRLESAINLSERVGMPEARIIMGHIVVEMAISPKSNSTYLAINEAINDVKKGLTGAIPKNIEIYSKTYVYPHAFENSYCIQNYLPDKLKNKKYYIPRNNNVEKNLYKAYENMKGNK